MQLDEKLNAITPAWRLLRGLSTRPLDLTRVQVLRDASPSDLADEEVLAGMICRLGLNDEGLKEFPAHLHPWCGQGLLIWQFPNQFAPYLLALRHLGIRSYLEVGLRHGGSFVATVEYLQRFTPLRVAVGVDVIPCVSMVDYAHMSSIARFERVNSRSREFEALLTQLEHIDLVFIDSHHEADQCRDEWNTIRPRANAVAFHDIANAGCPGIAKVWNEIQEDPDFLCHEFCAQYNDNGPYMGIGLAVRRVWMDRSTVDMGIWRL